MLNSLFSLHIPKAVVWLQPFALNYKMLSRQISPNAMWNFFLAQLVQNRLPLKWVKWPTFWARTVLLCGLAVSGWIWSLMACGLLLGILSVSLQLIFIVKKNVDFTFFSGVSFYLTGHSSPLPPSLIPGYTTNQKWFADMVTACTSTKGVNCGIFSNSDDWHWILGELTVCLFRDFDQLIINESNYKLLVVLVSSSVPCWCEIDVRLVVFTYYSLYTDLLVISSHLPGSSTYVYPPANELPLWYDGGASGVASFDDFKAFGGFTTPYAKRFKKVRACDKCVFEIVE